MLFVFMSQPDFACNPHALWEYVKDNTNHETAWLVKRDKKYYELLRRGVMLIQVLSEKIGLMEHHVNAMSTVEILSVTVAS